MRSPLPRAVLNRLETGRLVVLSVLLGALVGGLCIVLRLTLDVLITFGARLTDYAPPGTTGEGGLMMAFGALAHWSLISLPVIGAACAVLIPAAHGDPLTQLVRGYHARGQWTPVPAQLRTLGATLLGNAAGLMIGRDSAFTMTGQLGARLMQRVTRLDAVELRTLTLAGAAAGLGAVLHAPLAAAVLIAEVLYRRFEFEFEIVMPCLLAAVAGTAVYGLAFGFTPLLTFPDVQVPAGAQLPAFLGVALTATLLGSLVLLGRSVLADGALTGWVRAAYGAAFGLATAAVATLVTPAVLGDGSGWVQLSAAGFVGAEGAGQAAWRWVLLALGMHVAFGGGVLPSVGVGGLLGAGLGSLMGVDTAVATMVGAAAFLTVTLNVPLAATLLTVTWGGEALLPVTLAASGLAHLLSGTRGVVPAQVQGRRDSGVHASSPGWLPDTVRFIPRRVADSPAVPFDAPGEPPLDADVLPSPTNERELYRRVVPPSWRGARLGVVTLPPGVDIVGVVRDGAVRLPRPEYRLTASDELVFLARPDAYTALEGVLRLPGA
ncbi:chloride channel protein [Deinococcus taeanensis]|uniref:chloride channel protein n=1 Tax=Deinococcus taeanensis TaxID=2737050 RepID=UPI001CDCAB2A|nr:chloride channel protein [Deinococcus taeanensis]UBV43828.1 chloride channel protein [Deinococcus taeanensis]